MGFQGKEEEARIRAERTARARDGRWALDVPTGRIHELVAASEELVGCVFEFGMHGSTRNRIEMLAAGERVKGLIDELRALTGE